MLKYLITLLLLCTTVHAQEPVLPPDPATVKPDVKPAVVVPEEVKITVPKGVLGEGKRLAPYVFDSTTKCFISLPLVDAASLKTLVWHTEDGPPDIEAINATTELPGTILSFSSGNVPGLFLIEADWDKGFSKIWLEIKGSGPAPPPIPPGPIPPGPVPPVPPIPVDPNVQTGFRVITVYESTNKLTKDQSNIMTAVRIRKYLDKVCTKGTDGQYKGLPEYRFWDKDGKDSSKDSATIKKMWLDIRPNILVTPMPFMAVEANGKRVAIPLGETATVEMVMNKLIELGGPE